MTVLGIARRLLERPCAGIHKAIRSGSGTTVRRIAGSAGWLLVEQMYRLAVALLVGVWIARHLGPERFGELSYAISFVGLFGSLAYLGLDGIVTRELIRAESQWRDSDAIMGTAALLRLAGAFLGGCVATVAAVAVGSSGRAGGALLVAIISVGTLFQALDCIDFYFQARLESKFVARARMLSLSIGATIKLALISVNAPLWAFAAAFAGDTALRSIAMYFIYQRQGGDVSRWTFQKGRASRLLSESWPLLLSAATASIYLKIDQVMLRLLVDEREVGIYAAAVRMSEIWYFIPGAIAAALLPPLVQMHSENAERYRGRLQRSYDTLLALGFVVAGSVAIVAGPAVKLLYGDSYAGAERILIVHVFACPAVFVGAVLSKWLIVERNTMFSLTRHALGAITNIVLNLTLIPRYGGVGAAIATVVSYTVANFVSTLVTPRTREAGRMMSLAAMKLTTHPIRALRGMAR